MRVRRKNPLSLRWPITLFVVILVLIVLLTALWNVALVYDYQKFRELAQETSSFHWTLIALGSSLFLAIIVLSSILGAQLIARTRWSQRQSSFVASVTHELNSPLSAIKLFAQTLQEPSLAETDRRRFTGNILVEVDRLHRVVGNILRAAEIDHRGEQLRVTPKTVRLIGFLEEYAEEVLAVRESEIELVVTGDADAYTGVDRVMFRQVLNNLVDNAVRHGRRRPVRLELTVVRSEGQVEIRARDNGVGIPPDGLKTIFRPFARLEKVGPERGSGGMGIGLFVVRSIVEAHGGKVGASSGAEGAGTTIWIRLPEAADQETAA